MRMSAAVFARMLEQARAQAPLEACGYLAGRDGLVERDYPLTNADASPEHFSFLPAEQFAAVRDLRTRGLAALAVWHSHPASPARPSAEDIRLASDPDIAYVILSLAGPAPALRSFRIRGGAVEEEPVEIAAEDET